MTHDLSGKTALVTGASRGLGEAMAVKLAACGRGRPSIISAVRSGPQQVVERIRKAGGTAEAFQADVRDEAAVGGSGRAGAARSSGRSTFSSSTRRGRSRSSSSKI